MKTQLNIISALSEIIGENSVYESIRGIRVNHRFYLYALFIADGELEIKDVHGRWRKLIINEGAWTTVELDAKDNWREVSHKWANEIDILTALENHFELRTTLLKAA